MGEQNLVVCVQIRIPLEFQRLEKQDLLATAPSRGYAHLALIASRYDAFFATIFIIAAGLL